MNFEAEIRELKRRVGELEGGWGFLTSQIRDVHRDLLGFQAETDEHFDKVDARLDKVEQHLGRVEGRLGRVEGRLDGVEGRLGGVEHEVRSLRDDLPGIVGGAVREAMRDSRA